MIDLAEEQFEIPIRFSSLSGFFGLSSQGYYKHREMDDERNILISNGVLFCYHLHEIENLPKAGCCEFFELYKQYSGEFSILARDLFFRVLREDGFMLRRARYRLRTNNSNHKYHIYPDLLNTIPKSRIVANEELSNTPNLVISDVMMPEMDGMEISADAYIVKPFNTELLRTTIANLISNRQLLKSKFSGVQE